MLRLKEDQVVPSVLSVYNRIKQYRPHLSEQERFTLVQKKVLKDYGLTVTNENLTKIVEVQENLKPEVPVKKKFNFESHNEWCKKKTVIEHCVNMQSCSEQFPANHFVFRGNLQTSSPKPPLHTRVIKTATKKLQNNNKENSNIYERLYESRKKPCPKTVESVRKIRESCAPKPKSTKRTQKRYCTVQEPMCKKGRYSKECLDGTLNSSVFERLYGEKKQLNFKKLTDVQKREVHLRRQREEFRKVQMARASLLSCQCSGCHNQSSTSDFDFSDAGEVSDITIDSTVVNDNDSGLDGYDCTMLGRNNILNSTTNTEANNEVVTGRVKDLVDSLTGRFQESMTLCVVDDIDESI
ncbi:unnamed protein product [Ceutorhynchus assimilis]|uniref:Uncharacterized protein n=1 Tax=Ceutorhynchus assimilis TaxID=467358 RepID=A0A9N9QQJ5_9CUCU|nr:unnamed protein product [Ceutorhynchus assimilis]